MINYILLITLCFFLFFKQLVADENLDKGKVIAENICSVCHGVNGQANTGGNSVLVPHLTAQNELYLIEKLKNKKLFKFKKKYLYNYILGHGAFLFLESQRKTFETNFDQSCIWELVGSYLHAFCIKYKASFPEITLIIVYSGFFVFGFLPQIVMK